jgi:hypothetical protein
MKKALGENVFTLNVLANSSKCFILNSSKNLSKGMKFLLVCYIKEQTKRDGWFGTKTTKSTQTTCYGSNQGKCITDEWGGCIYII